MHAQVVSPHGDVPQNKMLTTLCTNLIKKAENNIKEDQYVGAPTFLVMNLLLINAYGAGNTELRPLPKGFPETDSYHTGSLWTVAFGKVDQQVLGESHQRDVANVEGTLGRDGILENPQFEALAGLLFIVHPLGGPSRLYGLWKGEKFEQWQKDNPLVSDTLLKLVGHEWNDDRDSNGANLNNPR